MEIYKVTNKVNGKIYIGQSKNFRKRKRSHINEVENNKDNMIFHKALKKYGIEQFNWEILWTGEEELLDEMEIYFIKENKSFIHSTEYDGSNGYNMTAGGCGSKGFKHSEESKLKMCNRIQSKETKLKIGIANSDKIEFEILILPYFSF